RASFVERLDDLRERLTELDVLLRDRVAILQRDENADFAAFVRETTTASGVYDLFFRSTSVDSARRSAEARRAALDRAASNASAERWGLAARALDECRDGRGVSELSENVEPCDALAAFLAWGARRGADWNDDAESTQASKVGPRESFGETANWEASEEVAPDADVASDSNVASGLSLSASSSEAAADAQRIRATRELTTGDLFAGGSSPDFGFVGGSGEREAPSAPASSEAFVAELPRLTRERLERSQEWTPDAETAEKTRRFRENLRRIDVK
ncbi:MAG: hypothetical protein J6X44_04410, partial [Thermoguttaceae bacterium]|nr:hypothetical protein [Thermoguttaceae bacterium]